MRRRLVLLSAAAVLAPAVAATASSSATSGTWSDPTGDVASPSCAPDDAGSGCAVAEHPSLDVDELHAARIGDDLLVSARTLAPLPSGRWANAGLAAAVTTSPVFRDDMTVLFAYVEQDGTTQAFLQEGDDMRALDCAVTGGVADTVTSLRLGADCLDELGDHDAVWLGAATMGSTGGSTFFFDEVPDTSDDEVELLGPVMTEATAAGEARRAGDSRYHTGVAVSAGVFTQAEDVEVVYLARGVPPLVDGLAGGMLADGPVLLVPPSGELPQVVADEIARLDPARVVALGGPGAIDDEVLAAAAEGREALRLAGGSRYETAVDVSAATFPDGADVVFLARGVGNLIDAVAGGTLVDGPVLLVPPTGDVPQVVLDEIARLDPSRVVALGGPVAIDDGVLSAAAEGRDAQRLAGDDRYATAVRIAEATFTQPSQVIYLARATGDPVDALSGGMVVDGPVLLVPATGELPQVVAEAIGRLATDDARVVALGGEGAISRDVHAQALAAR